MPWRVASLRCRAVPRPSEAERAGVPCAASASRRRAAPIRRGGDSMASRRRTRSGDPRADRYEPVIERRPEVEHDARDLVGLALELADPDAVDRRVVDRHLPARDLVVDPPHVDDQPRRIVERERLVLQRSRLLGSPPKASSSPLAVGRRFPRSVGRPQDPSRYRMDTPRRARSRIPFATRHSRTPRCPARHRPAPRRPGSCPPSGCQLHAGARPLQHEPRQRSVP